MYQGVNMPELEEDLIRLREAHKKVFSMHSEELAKMSYLLNSYHNDVIRTLRDHGLYLEYRG